MKFDFTFYNPTRVHFGKNAMINLHKELENYGKNVLLLYGKGSIKKMGLYDEVVGILNASGKKSFELSGIKPNPSYDQLLEGARIVKENSIDLILAVGGGSVIDCAKGISVSAYANGDVWQRYWVDHEMVDNKIVPVGCIQTMAGTASEMNGGSVITNERKMIKAGRVFKAEANPKFAILNPEFTYSVPMYQMTSGIFDTMSHLLEQYLSGNDDNTTDYIIEGVLSSLINSARVAIKDPKNYEARSNIFWCSTMALNGVTGASKEGDWMVHMIEHQLGAYTDCAHGVGLAVISPHYYRYIYKFGVKKFARIARNVWGVDESDDEIAALLGIDRLESFIKELGIPTTLRELGTTKEMLPLIAKSCVKTRHGYKLMSESDVLEVLEAAY